MTGVTLSTPQGPQDLPTDGGIVTSGFRPDAMLLRGIHFQVDAASGGPEIDPRGRLSDPACFAAGNMLRGVETAGWCLAERQRTARAILAALEGRLPRPGGTRLRLDHPALRLAVPAAGHRHPRAGCAA